MKRQRLRVQGWGVDLVIAGWEGEMLCRREGKKERRKQQNDGMY